MANFNVVAEETVQVLVEDTIDLFTPAQKIDQIVARVENLRCHIIPDKVIFQAVLHKQIFFVNEENVVVHQGADIPFSGFVDLPGVLPGQCCQLLPEIVFIEAELIDGETLREVVVIYMTVRVLDLTNLENIICHTAPNQVRVFTGRGQNFSTREQNPRTLVFTR